MGNPLLESTRLRADNRVPAIRNSSLTNRLRTEMILEQDEYFIPCIDLPSSRQIPNATKRFKRVKFLKDKYFVTANSSSRSQPNSILDLDNLDDELFQSADYSSFSKSSARSQFRKSNNSLLSNISKPVFENTDSFSMGDINVKLSTRDKSASQSIGDTSYRRSNNISRETPLDFTHQVSDRSDSINYLDKLQEFVNKKKELMKNVSSVVSENISGIEPPARMLFNDSVLSSSSDVISEHPNERSMSVKSKTSSLQNSKSKYENEIKKEHEDNLESSPLKHLKIPKSNSSAMKTHESFMDLNNLSSTSLISSSGTVPNHYFNNNLYSERIQTFSNRHGLLSDISDISLLDSSRSRPNNVSARYSRQEVMNDEISNLKSMDSNNINRQTSDGSKKSSFESKFGMLDDISKISLVESVKHSTISDKHYSMPKRSLNFSSTNQYMIDNVSDIALIDTTEVDDFELTNKKNDIIIVKSPDEDEWKMNIKFAKLVKKDDSRKENAEINTENYENIDDTFYETDGKISRGVQFPSRATIVPLNPPTSCLPRKRFSLIPTQIFRKRKP
ncbi:uncharacterized protein LOC143912639 [Arctopsyche grandis]|uniref:uncharacterized protein LOC143912639 n=1 Tax=Arctopsyche grandis TaxID=121162 RepID=UPI00406D99F9